MGCGGVRDGTWRGVKPGGVLLEELGRELTLKVEGPQLTQAYMFLHSEDSSLPTFNHSSKGKAFVQECMAEAQCQTPGNRSILPLSSLGVAGTAHPVSSADREMEP